MTGALVDVAAPTVARRVFAGLLDNAAAFPPASMPVEGAVALHRAAEEQRWRWVLGRLLMPIVGLEEMGSALDGLWPATGPKVQVGAVCEEPLATRSARSQLPRAGALDERVELALVEARIGTQSLDEAAPLVADLAAIATGHGAAAVAEVDVTMPQADVNAFVAMIAGVPGVLAKVRCGGPSGAPPAERLGAFVVACAQHDVPFKATAGMHQPIVHGAGHGFVNLLVATVLARRGRAVQEVVAALDAADPTSLWSSGGPSWRGEAFEPDEVDDARAHGFVALGTCSLTEPVTALARLGWLL